MSLWDRPLTPKPPEKPASRGGSGSAPPPPTTPARPPTTSRPPPRGAAPSTTPVQPAPEKPLEAGSWEGQRQPLPSRHLGDMRKGRLYKKRIAPDKTRRHSLSVCVSIEEEERLRAAAFEAGENFSEWARKVLFAATGGRIPARSRG